MCISVRQELTKRRAWLNDKGDAEARAEAQLREVSARPAGDDTAHALSGIAASLASFLGVRGELAVLDSRDSGWRDVQRSLLCWRLRIAVERALYARGALSQRSLGLEHTARVVALSACIAVVLRRVDDEAWLVRQLSAMQTDSRMVRPRWWTNHSVPSFVARLFDLGVIDNVKPPYRAILEHGNDERQLVRALGAACDYHVAHMAIGHPSHEFADGPFGLIPFEILAILALRQRVGRPSVPVSHQLLGARLTSTLAYATPTAVDDPLLAALTAEANRSVDLARDA